jgi:peptidoglycan/LPS O-acetylase OafA/YrhL
MREIYVYILGIINYILSWKLWIPLSRLCYTAYLIHQIVILYFYSTLEHTIHVNDQIMVKF